LIEEDTAKRREIQRRIEEGRKRIHEELPSLGDVLGENMYSIIIPVHIALIFCFYATTESNHTFLYIVLKSIKILLESKSGKRRPVATSSSIQGGSMNGDALMAGLLGSEEYIDLERKVEASATQLLIITEGKT
ncbi:hypothetical protein ACJX0J_014708, partial [Zea mays]